MRVLVIEDDSVRGRCGARCCSPAMKSWRRRPGHGGLLKAETEVPDAIVLDLGLPEIDGMEVCRRLRSVGNRTPILMLDRSLRFAALELTPTRTATLSFLQAPGRSAAAS